MCIIPEMILTEQYKKRRNRIEIYIYSKMNSSYEPSPLIIDPFIFHFLSSTIEPPPPLPSSIFFYDPFLVVPPPPPVSIITSPPLKVRLKYSIENIKFDRFQISKPINLIRHRYTPIQLFILHRIFLQLPYPSLEKRRLIAEHLQIDVEQVRIWFSNRRSRQRIPNQQTNLIRPTSNEYFTLKELFDKLNLVI
jgi:hypothetical protein